MIISKFEKVCAKKSAIDQQTLRFNSVHSVLGNLNEIKALIHFLNWGRRGEKERKRERQDFNLGRVEAGKSDSYCLIFNNLCLWFRVVIYSVCHFFHRLHMAI